MKNYAAAAAVLALVVASPRAQGHRPITEKDLFKFTWIADPQISPDGAAIAFVRVTVNEKDNRYETAVYVAAASGGAIRRQASRFAPVARPRRAQPTCPP